MGGGGGGTQAWATRNQKAQPTPAFRKHRENPKVFPTGVPRLSSADPLVCRAFLCLRHPRPTTHNLIFKLFTALCIQDDVLRRWRPGLVAAGEALGAVSPCLAAVPTPAGPYHTVHSLSLGWYRWACTSIRSPDSPVASGECRSVPHVYAELTAARCLCVAGMQWYISEWLKHLLRWWDAL